MENIMTEFYKVVSVAICYGKLNLVLGTRKSKKGDTNDL